MIDMSTYQEIVANTKSSGLIGTEVVQVVSLTSKRGLDVVHDGFRD